MSSNGDGLWVFWLDISVDQLGRGERFHGQIALLSTIPDSFDPDVDEPSEEMIKYQKSILELAEIEAATTKLAVRADEVRSVAQELSPRMDQERNMPSTSASLVPTAGQSFDPNCPTSSRRPTRRTARLPRQEERNVSTSSSDEHISQQPTDKEWNVPSTSGGSLVATAGQIFDPNCSPRSTRQTRKTARPQQEERNVSTSSDEQDHEEPSACTSDNLVRSEFFDLTNRPRSSRPPTQTARSRQETEAEEKLLGTQREPLYRLYLGKAELEIGVLTDEKKLTLVIKSCTTAQQMSHGIAYLLFGRRRLVRST
ncbi:uncharacterized protein LOC132198921 isoform X2 [Neocloeon triangulifer]|uniref:uncharacterized protein LOC132198921 isoform X2 n=1 Tax=Neocloeon triangulifer TaxID=2078957 RepID=UPI00286F8EA6|nr:uncharacterized protein LOC132198921 isoform X2 [Neocloeon triangulifer]